MKVRLIFIVLAVLLIMSNSTGFDLYSHSTIHYYYKYEPHGAFYNIFDIIVLPRYFLLSYIYETTSYLGIPLGYIAIALVVYPLNTIIVEIQRNIYDNSIDLKYILIIFMALFSIFLYSGISLSLVWAFAYLLSSKKRFLLGALFHPIGVVIFIAITLVSKRLKLKHLIILILIFLFFVWFESSFLSIYNSGNLIYSSIDIFGDLVVKRIAAKEEEFYKITYIVLGYLVLNRFKIVFRLRYKLVVIFSIIFVGVIVGYMIKKPTLINCVFLKKDISNIVIQATWIDFGAKEIEVGYDEMYKSRYESFGKN